MARRPKKEKESLTEGSIPKALLRLAVPIVFTNLLQSMYQLTDTFWVGRIGPIAVAAVSLSFPVLFFMISLGLGFAIAGSVLVAQYAGERSYAKVNLVCGQTFLVMTSFSLAMSVIGYLLSPSVIALMSHDAGLRESATSYLQLSFIGLFFTYAYVMFQSLFRGMGNVKDPLIIVSISVLMNFILDPLLINGWGPVPAYGVDGAAYATIATQGVAAVIGILFMTRGSSGLQMSWRDLFPVPREIKKVINLGIPACAEQSTRALSMLVMMFLVSTFGTTGTAAYGVVARVLSFIIIPAMGFSMATSTIVGQNIGASHEQRAIQSAKVACLVIFCALTAAGIVLFFVANELMAVFVPTAPLVQEEGARFIRVISLTFGLLGIQQVASGALRGGGSTLLAMILAIVALWVFRFPLAYVLSKHTSMGIQGVWWAFCLSNIFGAILGIIALYRSDWIRKVTSDLAPLERKALEETIIGENISD